MTTVERSFRGISLRLAAEYLRGLGGAVVEPLDIDPDEAIDPDDLSDSMVIEGDGWRVRLTAETIEIGPSLTLTEVTVVFESDAEGDWSAAAGSDRDERQIPTDLDALVEQFARKAVRAGG